LNCILRAAEVIEEFDAVIVPTSATGHLAEKDKIRGYCVFNDTAVLVEKLSERYRVAVVETDAHHGVARDLIGDKAEFFCISPKKDCKIKDDRRCILARSLEREDYIEAFSRLTEKLKNVKADVFIWYLGQDLHEFEYSDLKLKSEDFRKLAELLIQAVKGRKFIVILASGSREDVFSEILQEIADVISKQ
jgi:acetoin utilization deacetylase AcuC-like enzyme